MKTYIYDEEGNEVPINVDFKYWPPTRGYRDKYGAPEEPDTPAEIEVISVLHQETGEEVTLTDQQMEKVEAECWECVAEWRDE